MDKALGFLAQIEDVKIEKISEFRGYPAEGICAGQPDFLNGVIRIETSLEILEVLHKLQGIERRMGRLSGKGEGTPRHLDLDILGWEGGVVIEGKTLVIPHPKMHERIFVLEPLAEIDPDWEHPRLKKTARQLLDEIRVPSVDPQPQDASSPA